MKDACLKDPGLEDGRKLSGGIVEYLCHRAVHAVREFASKHTTGLS